MSGGGLFSFSPLTRLKGAPSPGLKRYRSPCACAAEAPLGMGVCLSVCLSLSLALRLTTRELPCPWVKPDFRSSSQLHFSSSSSSSPFSFSSRRTTDGRTWPPIVCSRRRCMIRCLQRSASGCKGFFSFVSQLHLLSYGFALTNSTSTSTADCHTAKSAEMCSNSAKNKCFG